MICIYQVIPGASQKNPDLVTNSGPIPDHFWHLGPDPDQVRNSGPYWSHWILKKILDSDWVLSKLLGRVSSNHCSELFMTIGMGLVREPF